MLPYPYPLGSHHSVGTGSWHRGVPDAWLSASQVTCRTVLVSLRSGPRLRVDSKQRLHGCGRWDEEQFAIALTWGTGERALLLGALTEWALMPDTLNHQGWFHVKLGVCGAARMCCSLQRIGPKYAPTVPTITRWWNNSV